MWTLAGLTVEDREVRRLRIEIGGAVQGVGFRPFIYRLATDLALSGSVGNSPQGVRIEIEGETERLDEFMVRLDREKPPYSVIESKSVTVCKPSGQFGFRIVESGTSGKRTALVLPDIATCPDCVREIFDPDNRRYGYPFTNCTHCGPRFSIVESLPYDRSNTTMREFRMCEECLAEYEDPRDRRFHAQPNACPKCGPHLELWDCGGGTLASQNEALLMACDAIRTGKILALKGLGGFQLIADAANGQAVGRLRARKARKEKPFALMYSGLESALATCELSEIEREVLCSPESPIVLLRRRSHAAAIEHFVHPAVAPGSPYLGVMLPYTPLHHLLMAELKFPVVATSGNLRDEPIYTDQSRALALLGSVADLFLVHNRSIANFVDDSVVRIVMDRSLMLRRARGYTPLPLLLRRSGPSCLAVGGHQKNCVALSRQRHVFVSQHIGDLETKSAYDTAADVVGAMSKLHDIRPEVVACDKHPDYMSTRLAQMYELPRIRAQHHFAHVLSCMAENGLAGTVLGVSWDGSGFGTDRTVWGGEFLRTDYRAFSRVAHFRTFCLPGNEKSVLEPRRSAMGLLYEIFGDRLFDMIHMHTLQAFDPPGIKALRKVLPGKINSPVTSSAGRLFDAVASIAGLCQITSFEGQAAMALEFACDGIETESGYSYERRAAGPSLVIDWEPMIREILSDMKMTASPGLISAKFHNTLVDIIVDVAQDSGEQKIVLTGGCFQNKRLTELTISSLRASGFDPYWHRDVPPNDGGLALGQIVAGMYHRTDG